MALVYKNNSTALLASAISPTSTSIVVVSGQGDRFPEITSPDTAYLTLEKQTGEFEIVLCTNRDTDIFQVFRGQQYTDELSFSINDRLELRLTAAALESFIQSEGQDIDGGTF